MVRSRVINNWESQDEPEHFRTIRDRILKRDEQKAVYLLDLYQKVWQAGAIDTDNSIEQSDLQLAVIVVKKDSQLQVYNKIYRTVFNQDWIENTLASLRPYSESFCKWLASGKEDESLLLRGNTLGEAENWAKDKNLGFQDLEFLAASRTLLREEELAEEERKSELERERKDKEAAERARQIEAKAKEKAEKELAKANRRIRVGTLVLVVTLVIAGGLGIAAFILGEKTFKAQQDYEKIEKYLAGAKQLSELAGKISTINQEKAEEISKLANIKIDNSKFNYAFLLASKSLAYQYLGKLDKAQKAIDESLEMIDSEKEITAEKLDVSFFAYSVKGNLLVTEEKPEEAKKVFNKAFQLIAKYSPNPPKSQFPNLKSIYYLN